MNYYEHTLIARQDASQKQLLDFNKIYNDILKNFSGKLHKQENWGLLTFVRKIKNFNKGHYLHYKIEGSDKTIKELKKKIKMEKIIIRDLVIRYKKLDTKTEFFSKSREDINEKKK